MLQQIFSATGIQRLAISLLLAVAGIGEFVGILLIGVGILGLFFNKLKWFWVGVILYFVSLSIPLLLGGGY